MGLNQLCPFVFRGGVVEHPGDHRQQVLDHPEGGDRRRHHHHGVDQHQLPAAQGEPACQGADEEVAQHEVEEQEKRHRVAEAPSHERSLDDGVAVNRSDADEQAERRSQQEGPRGDRFGGRRIRPLPLLEIQDRGNAPGKRRRAVRLRFQGGHGWWGGGGGGGLLPFRVGGTARPAHRYNPWLWLLRGLFACFPCRRKRTASETLGRGERCSGSWTRPSTSGWWSGKGGRRLSRGSADRAVDDHHGIGS